MCCRRTVAWRTFGTRTTLCHPLLVPTYRNPLKTDVIHVVNDLNGAPFEWRILDVQYMAKVPTAVAGSTTLGVAVGPRKNIENQLLPKADVIRAMHERVLWLGGNRPGWRRSRWRSCTGCSLSRSHRQSRGKGGRKGRAGSRDRWIENTQGTLRMSMDGMTMEDKCERLEPCEM